MLPDYLSDGRKACVVFGFRDAVVDPDFSDVQCAEAVFHVDYQSSSNKAESPSASSTHDGSYFVFFICALQAGQNWQGFEKEALQAEQMNSSALKR